MGNRCDRTTRGGGSSSSREMGIAETAGAGAHWAIDLLIVDQDAVPTLAEVKLGSNPEIRRTVVGQMLEYAAHAAQTWTADELRGAFEESCSARKRDPDDELARLLQGRSPGWRWILAAGGHEPCGRTAPAAVHRGRHPRPSQAGSRVPQRAHAGDRSACGGNQAVSGRVDADARTARHREDRSGASRTTGNAGKMTRESFLAALPTEEARDVAVRLLTAAERQDASLILGKGLCQRSGVCGRRIQAGVEDGGPARGTWGQDVGSSRPPTSSSARRTNHLTTTAAAQNIDLLEARLAKAVSELRSP